MFAEFAVKMRGKRALVAGGDIGFDVLDFAHAGDDGGNVLMIQDEAKRHFGHGAAGGNERLEGVGVFDAGAKIFRDKISAAPIVGGPDRLQSERSSERTFVKGNAGDDAYIMRAARGEKFVFGILVKDVVNDLDSVDEAGLYGTNAVPGLPTVHADADVLNLSAGA